MEGRVYEVSQQVVSEPCLGLIVSVDSKKGRGEYYERDYISLKELRYIYKLI